MTDAIVVDSLCKRYGQISALDDVSFRIADGDLFGLLGPNGAGKSTLIHILATLLEPTAGTATVAGHSVLTDRGGVRSSIGIVFQAPALDEVLTGRENLAFHAVMYGLSPAERRERITDVLDLVGLADRADDRVGTYSGGMKRRLEIARGLLHRPTILFLDEPTLGLDAQTRRRIWTAIRRLNWELGVTIVLTTHYMEEADALCDRIGVIDGGSLVEIDTPAALKSQVGGDVVTVTVAGCRDGFRELVEEADWVQAIEESDGAFHLTVDRGRERLPTLVGETVDLDGEITAVTMREPSLEDVFIALTGRRIRDERPGDRGGSRLEG